MKLKDVIAFCDRVKPNAFTEADKTQWINDFEMMTQSDELLLHPDDIVNYVWQSTYSGDIEFIDDRTIRLPKDFDARSGGEITISGMASLTQNEGTYIVEQMFYDDKTLIFAKDSFVAGTDHGSMFYDGSGSELILPDLWHKLYVSYLCAQIDLFNGEYDKYANTMEVFNSYYEDYKVWYTTHWPTRKEVEG